MSEHAGIATTVGDTQASPVLTGMRVWTRVHDTHLVTTHGSELCGRKVHDTRTNKQNSRLVAMVLHYIRRWIPVWGRVRA